MSLTTRVLIALLGGLALGILVSVTGNPGLERLALGIEPVGTLFINAIRMTVIPLVVGSLIAGIADTPNPATLGRGGIRALLIYVGTLVAGGIFSGVLAPPILARLPIDPAASAALQASAASTVSATQENMQRLPGFADWLIGLVPNNPMRAAADGAMLPLIVFSLFFGLAIAGLKGDARATVVRVFEAIRDASLTLVQWVLRTAPIGVFALAVPLATRLGVSAAGAIAAYNGLTAVMTTVFIVTVLYPMAALLGACRSATSRGRSCRRRPWPSAPGHRSRRCRP